MKNRDRLVDNLQHYNPHDSVNGNHPARAGAVADEIMLLRTQITELKNSTTRVFTRPMKIDEATEQAASSRTSGRLLSMEETEVVWVVTDNRCFAGEPHVFAIREHAREFLMGEPHYRTMCKVQIRRTR